MTTHRVEVDRGPHVVDGIVQWFSATVLTAADERSAGGCRRKHWFTYVDPDRVEVPPTKGQSVGILTHDKIERALRGEAGLLSPLALNMLREADAHRGALAGALVEAPVGEIIPTEGADPVRMLCAGVPFYGHADVVIPGRDQVEVLDWKTTSSIARWAKTGLELLETLQMLAYGEWAARRFAARRVRLTHVYGDTKTSAASRRSVLAGRDQIAAGWEYVQSVGRRIIEHAPCPGAEEVEPNPKACGAYGGCPFRGRCSVGRRTMLEATMGLMSKRKESLQPAAPAAPAPEGDVRAELAALEAEAAKARAALGADVPETGVVPPDAPPSEHPLPEEGKKGKGRPRGSKNKPKVTGPTEDESSGETGRDTSLGPPSQISQGFLLEVYVDCVATFPTTPLHPYLAKICRDLCDEHGALDVRCAPADSHLAFGRWKGYLAERIRREPPAPDSYSIDTRGSEIAEVAADVLREVAPVFVRGIR